MTFFLSVDSEGGSSVVVDPLADAVAGTNGGSSYATLTNDIMIHEATALAMRRSAVLLGCLPSCSGVCVEFDMCVFLARCSRSRVREFRE